LPAGNPPFLLIGWTSSAEAERDGGVPEVAALVLVRAFSRLGPLTYLRSSQPVHASSGSSRSLAPSGIRARVNAALGREPGKCWSVTTSDPAQAVELFSDPGFPWWMQAQLLIVSGEPPSPEPSREALVRVIDPAVALSAPELSALGACAIVRPGVDGDVAGITCRDAEVENALLAALTSEASAAGGDCFEVDEHVFARRLSELA
jgi:hypothetical protein